MSFGREPNRHRTCASRLPGPNKSLHVPAEDELRTPTCGKIRGLFAGHFESLSHLPTVPARENHSNRLRSLATLGALCMLGIASCTRPQSNAPASGTRHLNSGAITELRFQADSDDRDYAGPGGYFANDPPAHRFTRRLALENSSKQPVRDFRLVVNDIDLSTRRSVIGHASESYPGQPVMLAVWRSWISARFHREVGAPSGMDPVAVLTGLGHTLCGEDAVAVAGLARTAEVPCRTAPWVGHVAYEYWFDGGWRLLDGDQNVYFVDWDNRSLVSARALMEDPLLAVRTKIFGRTARFSLSASMQNAAQLDRADPSEPRRVHGNSIKHFASVERGWTLFPGERLEFIQSDTSPHAWVELQFDPQARATADGRVHLELPLPLEEVRAGRERVPFTLPDQWSGGIDISLENNRSDSRARYRIAAASFPYLRTGSNHIELRGGKGQLELRWETDPAPPAKPAAPRFDPARLLIDPAPDRTWWQIAENGDFTAVHPNLDQVLPGRQPWELNAFDRSFLDETRAYRIRARVLRGGVWSDWSDPVPFEVHTPPLPSKIRCTPHADGTATFEWNSTDREAVLCGSDRIDFVPEPLSAITHTQIRDREALDEKPNANVVARTRDRSVTVPIRHRFYRLLWGSDLGWRISPLYTLSPSVPAQPGIAMQLDRSRFEALNLYEASLQPIGEVVRRSDAPPDAGPEGGE